LREEGTSFQALKDELRRDIAIYHLGRADLSLQEIAEQLGFPNRRRSIGRSRSGRG
jgi:AraC-like DNA-binding protein